MDEKLCISLICIAQQMDAVVLRLDQRLAERLHLKRAAAHKNACGLVAAQLAGLRMEGAIFNVNIQRMTLHLNAATLTFTPQDAAEIIPICVIQCLDGIVGALHSKVDVLIERVGRAAPNALSLPILLLKLCTRPCAFRNLTTRADLFLDAALTVRFERDLLKLLRCG